MFERRSLKGPITLGVSMIILVVLLIAGWISMTILLGTRQGVPNWVYWALLAVGSILLIFILLGVIAYLTLSVKAINLNRRQSNFIDSVTHELKSPIASLKLYLQTLTMRSVNEEQRAHFQRFMLDDLERLDQLINHLLEAGRVDRGDLSSDDQEVRIDELLQICAETVCLRYGIPLDTVRIDSPPLTMTTKPVQVDILFRNLIDNAVKYGGSPREVIVRVKSQGGDRLVASIVDNGPGIPAKLRRKIFGRFVRLGSELERSQPGTGLGLYLVRNVARSLNGSVRVHDRKDKVGTEFEVTLPGAIRETSGCEAVHAAPDVLSDEAGNDRACETKEPGDQNPATKQLSRFRFPWYESLTRRATVESALQENSDDQASGDGEQSSEHDTEADRR